MPDTIPIHLTDPEGLENTLAELGDQAAAWVRLHGFKADAAQALTIPDTDGGLAAVIVGLGAAEKRARTRFPIGKFARAAPEGSYRLASDLPPYDAARLALGWQLAQYRFTRYKGAKRQLRELETPPGVDQTHIDAMVAGSTLARDLINTPSNDMGPEALEVAARNLAEAHGAEISVITGDALLEANFPLIHTVGRASSRAPRLIELTWGSGPEIALVGKGVCFDTGGLDLKSASGMSLMKKDMGGAANILGLAKMVMTKALPVRLRVLVPAVENSVSGNAFRPGDVFTSRKGLTVEINNTDAEGRLVLADALALACEHDPALVLDMATLTGAARVALGPDLPPFFTDDETLASDLSEGGARGADPVWRMPLWPAYEPNIEPQIADLDNAPSGGFAGAITAALFLKRFVDRAEWAHFDIYGWAPKDLPGRPRGGEAQACRAAFEMLRKRYG
ncbi:MAG: leucyl aminopeptidase family protein [Pseudomonadota bacterium]